jgi:ring-1,2-phenylacetyl-CoA epoxidase subunit PaaD
VVSPATATRPLESAIWAALADVHDPEIPTVSVVDLGVVGAVETGPGSVRVELLPTFVGCPALEVMRASVEHRLREFADQVAVDFTFNPPWTSERITPAGRDQLRLAGFAPPADDETAECPFCGSRNTTLDNAFGPTLCRAIYHCNDCRQPFEQFKLI